MTRTKEHNQAKRPKAIEEAKRMGFHAACTFGSHCVKRRCTLYHPDGWKFGPVAGVVGTPDDAELVASAAASKTRSSGSRLGDVGGNQAQMIAELKKKEAKEARIKQNAQLSDAELLGLDNSSSKNKNNKTAKRKEQAPAGQEGEEGQDEDAAFEQAKRESEERANLDRVRARLLGKKIEKERQEEEERKEQLLANSQRKEEEAQAFKLHNKEKRLRVQQDAQELEEERVRVQEEETQDARDREEELRRAASAITIAPTTSMSSSSSSSSSSNPIAPSTTTTLTTASNASIPATVPTTRKGTSRRSTTATTTTATTTTTTAPIAAVNFASAAATPIARPAATVPVAPFTAPVVIAPPYSSSSSGSNYSQSAGRGRQDAPQANWTCHVCTYVTASPLALSCSMCGTERAHMESEMGPPAYQAPPPPSYPGPPTYYDIQLPPSFENERAYPPRREDIAPAFNTPVPSAPLPAAMTWPTPANTPSVAAFLGFLGLQAWARVFDEQEVELDLLPDLSGDDMVSMGLPLGARVKILAAAKRFR